jgi:hypothetical protein
MRSNAFEASIALDKLWAGSRFAAVAELKFPH